MYEFLHPSYVFICEYLVQRERERERNFRSYLPTFFPSIYRQTYARHLTRIIYSDLKFALFYYIFHFSLVNFFNYSSLNRLPLGLSWYRFLANGNGSYVISLFVFNILRIGYRALYFCLRATTISVIAAIFSRTLIPTVHSSGSQGLKQD